MNLKKFKPLHWIYNLVHFKALQHNKLAYEKYNLNKPLIASISSKDFPDKTSKAWLDIGDSSELVEQKQDFASFPLKVREQMLKWSSKGYMILEEFFDAETCDRINTEIDGLIQSGSLRFTNGNKLMFAGKRSSFINAVANNEQLKNILSFILGKDLIAFQTINFINGSQQRPHSDSIHMTTYPLGYLIAAWIALEDITAESGPLVYYPGSHKLPFLLNSDYNKDATALTLGKKTYKDYEDMVEDIVVQKGYRAQEFLARKGDVLIWHANLVHGGAPILNPSLTRKSMVVHFYAKDVIKYHEITERPSLMDDKI